MEPASVQRTFRSLTTIPGALSMHSPPTVCLLGPPLSVSGRLQFLVEFENKGAETHQASLSHRGGPAGGQNPLTGPRSSCLVITPPPTPTPSKWPFQPLPLPALMERTLSPDETIVFSQSHDPQYGPCRSLPPGNRGGISSRSSGSRSNYPSG